MDSETSDRFEAIDKELKTLTARLEKVEGVLHITRIDDVGVPNAGERTSRRDCVSH
jgi:hypothetical protein